MPLRKKRFGIRIGAHGISALETKGSARPGILSLWRKELKVDFSPASLNASLSSALSEAGFRNGSVSFSIPDELARIAILEFDELPGKREDADGIIKARAARLQAIESGAYAHDFQELKAASGKRVLSVMVKKDIIDALEQASARAGLSVRAIGIDSFSLANLLPVGEDAAIFLKVPDFLVIAFFRGGGLDFYRCKNTCTDGDGSIKREITSTLAHYMGLNQDLRIRKAYVLFDGFESEIAGALPADIETAGIGALVPHDAGANKLDISALAALGACI